MQMHLPTTGQPNEEPEPILFNEDPITPKISVEKIDGFSLTAEGYLCKVGFAHPVKSALTPSSGSPLIRWITAIWDNLLSKPPHPQ